jgi:exodeoxyribonuclease V alpha subunit
MLTPLGTARARIGAPPPRDLPEFPEDLARIAREADLGEERLYLAWELARLVPDLDRAGWRGLLVLLLLVEDAIAQGSTRLPIDPSSRDALRERARLLRVGDEDCALAAACADAILAVGAPAAGEAPRQLALPLDAAPAPTTAGYAALVGPPGTRRPLVLEDGALAPSRLVALEERLARRIRERAAPPLPPAAIEGAIEALRASPARTSRGPLVLTSEQEEAVRAALRGPVAIVSGGPGTGKTSIVVAILRALARIDGAFSVALAAPTGKAADRMAQSIRSALTGCADPLDAALAARLPEPSTLHRLLAWSPSEERFRHHEASPLAERMVIVDEASMIDLPLMERLVAALSPDARLVLLGDADQLPSVGPGAVLSDLVAAGRLPNVTTVRLTQSHRMDPRLDAGSHILGIAGRVRDGTSPPIAVPRAAPERAALTAGTIARLDAPADAEGVAFLEVAPRDRVRRESFLAWWWEHRVRGPAEIRELVHRTFTPSAPADVALLSRLFDHLEASRLLCITRGRPTGADAINAWMGERALRERGAPSLPLLSVGEPVMVVRNDYERALFNGDQGLVLWVAETPGSVPRPSLVVRRGEAYVSHRLDAVRHLLERAYATTVHKAQGSEHDVVALLLPDEDIGRLLTREVVYTAITRARRSVLLVGPPERFRDAVLRPTARRTGLSARLAASDPGTLRASITSVRP